MDAFDWSKENDCIKFHLMKHRNDKNANCIFCVSFDDMLLNKLCVYKVMDGRDLSLKKYEKYVINKLYISFAQWVHCQFF